MSLSILLLDEPYRALDSLTKSVMHEALLEIFYKNRVTIFFITHDLEEAIFLGHRVVIMTTRPCRPKKILDIDIPHPRDYSVLTTSGSANSWMKRLPPSMRRRSRLSPPARRSAEHGQGIHTEGHQICHWWRFLARRRLDCGVPDLLGGWFGVRRLGSVSRFRGFEIPPPTAVLQEMIVLVQDPSFWVSAWLSTLRVFEGFLAAMVIGIPLGLAMAVNRSFYGITFPVFEVLRPIPPLAWVPASIIFWPTQELSIAFVHIPGAFFTIVINVIGGAQAIDVRYFQAARSMGSSTWDIFRRIILPATVPSIVVVVTVGVGITWAVVVAAEIDLRWR